MAEAGVSQRFHLTLENYNFLDIGDRKLWDFFTEILGKNFECAFNFCELFILVKASEKVILCGTGLGILRLFTQQKCFY